MLLAGQTVTADTNSASANLKDLRNFAFLVVMGNFSFTGTNKIGLKMQESDDNSIFTDCPLSAYAGGVLKECIAAADANTTHVVEYKGVKQFVRLALDVSGTVSVAAAVAGISDDVQFKPAL